jgi:hypothetical protein
MILSLRYIIILFLPLFLIACKIPIYEPSIQQKQCVGNCLQQFQYCQNICTDNCPHCCIESSLRANESYQRYLRQSKIDGKTAIQKLQSFDDPLKCNKNSCNCQADLILCKQTCLGKVYKSLKTYNFC